MQYENPYLNTPPSEHHRTTFVIPKRRMATLLSIHPKEGVLQTTAAILMEKLFNELERIKLTSYDQSRFEHAVANAVLRLEDDSVQRGTASEPAAGGVSTSPGQAINRNDNDGNPSMAREVARPQELSDDASTSRKHKSDDDKKAKRTTKKRHE